MYVKVLLSTAVVLVAICGGRADVAWGDCPNWTRWFDDDDPFVEEGDAGDFEPIGTLGSNHPNVICTIPSAIQATTIPDDNGNFMYPYSTGDNIWTYNIVYGFACRNADQAGDRKCHDYRVRFCCPETGPICQGTWTDWFDKDDPRPIGDMELKDDDVCDDPTALEARVVGTHDRVYDTNEIFRFFDCDIGLICVDADQIDGMCEDYEVRFCCPEEEPEQNATLGSTPEPLCSIDIVIVIDVSSSMSASEFLRILWFLIEFILCFEANGVDLQVEVITYDCLPTLDIPLGEYPPGDLGLLGAIEGLERRGGRTRTGLALHYVKCMTDFREDTWSVVIVVTDGTEANGQGTNDYIAQAGMLRDSGIELYAVGVGYPFLVNTAALATITGNPDRVFSPSSTNPCELGNRIIDECCGEA